MTLQKVIDALIKIQNSKDPESSILKTAITKVDLHYYDNIVVTIGDKEDPKECKNCVHFDYCGSGKPVVCELFRGDGK